MKYMILHADDMVQGLMRHWLLRSPFKTKAAPPEKADEGGAQGRTRGDAPEIVLDL